MFGTCEGPPTTLLSNIYACKHHRCSKAIIFLVVFHVYNTRPKINVVKYSFIRHLTFLSFFMQADLIRSSHHVVICTFGHVAMLNCARSPKKHFRLIKEIATSGFHTALECTKFVSGRCCAPDPAPRSHPLAGLKGPSFQGKGKVGSGWEGMVGGSSLYAFN